MTIELIGGQKSERVLVTMEAAELDGYGVSFSAMSLSDPPTKAMLRDLLSMVTRMGLREEGERVQVDCVQTTRGGCALLISRMPEQEYYFASGDDVISAYLAGGVPAGRLERRGDTLVLMPCERPDGRQRRILSEFCLRATE